jgi:hypothetical protein
VVILRKTDSSRLVSLAIDRMAYLISIRKLVFNNLLPMDTLLYLGKLTANFAVYIEKYTMN